ncbi:S1 RNA-binding domain-containing protein [Kutzneria chonburiensis]|uniref:S1 RNA-binding domain-containing protein n=1 Tax=Kutzneria chonburiensis TaxID=1483604 RepID=A0ABV6MM22_9PSEU|nr:S1 RNA-binding domain-containing protein [Kutzneria chonburiensis]
MDRTSDEREFLATLIIGDIVEGTVVPDDRREAAVVLDGFPARPLAWVGALDLSWQRRRVLEVGERIIAEVMRVDLDRGVQLSTAATENPELWAFLKARQAGEVLTGTVAAIEPFGVFVALDDGPPHPIYPGVGFVTHPELAWGRIEATTDVVQVGQRVQGEFLVFDTYNGEARLSLKALEPNPFLDLTVGQEFLGRVTKVLPLGVFVAIRDRVEGLVRDLDPMPAVGDEIQVTVVAVDLSKVLLRPTASSGLLDE